MHSLLYIPLIIYAAFILFIWRGLRLKRNEKDNKRMPDFYLSVIVPCRNEQHTITKLIDSLKKQTFPKEKFEVIFVDDGSEDDTVKVIESAISTDNMQILKSGESGRSRGHKKSAIEQGIVSAKGEIIVTTDADCMVPEKWLEKIALNFDKDTGFLAGPVKLEYGSSIFSRLQSLEFAGLMLTSAGLIRAGFPVTCSAANIAYRKSVFNQLGGFKESDTLSSGDDEILMQRIDKETAMKVKYLWDYEVVVVSGTESRVSSFLEQRKRWASKSLFYQKPLLTLLLIVLFLFFLSLPYSLVYSFFDDKALDYLLTASGSKILVDFFVMKEGKGFFFDHGLMRYFGLAQLLHPFYIIYSAIAGLFGNFTWKGRQVKR